MILNSLKKHLHNLKNNYPDCDTLNIIGTGGGNDIFSALFVALLMTRIENPFGKIRLMGVLSPAAIHRAKKNNHLIRNYLFGSKDGKIDPFFNSIIRSVLTKKGETEISMPDNYLPDLINLAKDMDKVISEKLNILEVVHLDLFNNYCFHNALCLFGKEPIIGVDVGGDIFSLVEGVEMGNYVLSPLMDYKSLSFLKKIDHSVILEFGLGTDGESGPDIMGKAQEFQNKNNLVSFLSEYHEGSFIDKEDQDEVFVFKVFSALYNKLSEIRAGHTIDFLIKGINLSLMEENIFPKPETLTLNHKYTYKNANPHIVDEYSVTIPVSLINSFFIIPTSKLNIPDLKGNVIEVTDKIKQEYPTWASEIDGHWLNIDNQKILYSNLSKRINSNDISKLITERNKCNT